MDDLNRYITFNEINPTIAQKLREYFYETKYTRAAEARRAIVSEMSGDLQEEVCDLVNHAWIENVPFFRGLTTPDGLQIVQPAEKGFLAKVAVTLVSDVYAPMETPPAGRLYVIYKGSARYRGMVRSNGFSWGALDVMLVNAPYIKLAHAMTCRRRRRRRERRRRRRRLRRWRRRRRRLRNRRRRRLRRGRRR